ncbi:MAG: glycine/betaine ABC transporter substrate-binding protein [Clostridiales bacterium]|nr:glycine/betaine ABC transporter substrate-binding protein [Clostridiales bacterium]
MKKFIIVVLIMVVAASLLISCTQEEKKVVVASKPHSEQYILAEIITLLIESKTDIIVEQKLGIGGGTSNIHPAMMNGEIDIYPEYSGTGWLFVLKQDLVNDSDELYELNKDMYEEQFNLIWLDRYGFNNTYALAMPMVLAEELDVKTYTDLGKVSNQLKFGAEYDFYERDDGYNALSKIYGFDFKEKKELDIGFKYQAIDSKDVDVINAFSTDGLIQEFELRVLIDDKSYFPAYQAATVIRKETLDLYPELENILNLMAGLISDDEMVGMNYKVEKLNEDPKEVAREFLIMKGLL